MLERVVISFIELPPNRVERQINSSPYHTPFHGPGDDTNDHRTRYNAAFGEACNPSDSAAGSGARTAAATCPGRHTNHAERIEATRARVRG
jgi:hypothetical protein